MSIAYLCFQCSKHLALTGISAFNELGRKSCSRCGDGGRYLVVVEKGDIGRREEMLNRIGGKK